MNFFNNKDENKQIELMIIIFYIIVGILFIILLG